MQKFIKKTKSLLVSLFISLNFISIVEASDVEEYLNPNFYTAKIVDKDLWLVAERITEDNVDVWEKYGEAQRKFVDKTRYIEGNVAFDEHKNGSFLPNKMNQYEAIRDAMIGFLGVLNKERELYKKGEVWVVYISDSQLLPTPTKNPSQGFSEIVNINDYLGIDEEKDIDPFNKGIQMFMTVTTSPEALLTTHMGISRSIESLINNPNYISHKGISLDLHSFAAKVMLERNSSRKYMITTPLASMGSIILKNLPTESVFISSREMQDNFNKYENTSFEGFLKMKAQEVKDTFYKSWDFYISDFLHNNSSLFHINIPTPLISIDEFHSTAEMQQNLDKKFKEYKKPYFGARNKYKIFDIDLREKMLSKKSVLSAEDEYPFSTNKAEFTVKKFTFYEETDNSLPWLTVEKENPGNYAWLFAILFSPDQNPYVMIKLEDLANCRKIKNFDAYQ